VKKLLKDFTEEEYNILKSTGMLWEFYPEASGVFVVDCLKNFD